LAEKIHNRSGSVIATFVGFGIADNRTLITLAEVDAKIVLAIR
tara:strand:+ start:451 stop:579 length:129 start_codon:yes stop_codon:yes gene_type:complete